MKAGIWEKQAKKIGRSVADLKTWYKSLRTIFGRLKRIMEKSGAGRVNQDEWTERQRWLWSEFQFLSPFIHTTVSRRAVVSVSIGANLYV